MCLPWYKKNKIANSDHSSRTDALTIFNMMKNNIRNYKRLSILEKSYIATMSDREKIEIIYLYDSMISIVDIEEISASEHGFSK